MALPELLIAPIFLIPLILTMVGHGEGLIFSLIPASVGFTRSEDILALSFLNLTAASSAAHGYSRKKMVDFSLVIPLLFQWSAVAHFFSAKIDRIAAKTLIGPENAQNRIR
jgi:uncharacterized membrane protein YfcA